MVKITVYLPAALEEEKKKTLHNTYGRRWIGRNGPVARSEYSSDLLKVDFFAYVNTLRHPISTTPVVPAENFVAQLSVVAQLPANHLPTTKLREVFTNPFCNR
ncbi:hypothetical protein CEXT_769171 [Caerostris extrusa]|uniref:Uncharacterized protein n=1 Tax=Caerostris extrusa TaxID=172846 RepID=A0AAV4PN45_CAEEX|nr:hypothetical protein CEXT_769171 [Caerostris extrusa]